MSSKYDLNKMRQEMKKKTGGWSKDPNQFIPPTLKPGDEKKIYRFYILPPLVEGDKTADGTASRSMEVIHVMNGTHWHNKKPYPCPRVHDDAECPLCTLAFDLMNETQDKEARREIAKNYLPQQRFGVNIYFPNIDANPEDLRGKVKWFNASKQVLDIWEECLMRDSAGDPEDPQAFGVFYDEEGAYLFQLEVQHQGGFNEYKTSKFLANLGKQPIARAKKGDQVVPDTKRIQEILNSRHDIFTKFEQRDVAKIEQLVQAIVNKDSSATDAADAGFDVDEAKKPAQAAKPAAKPQNPPAKVKEEPVLEEAVPYENLSGEGAVTTPQEQKPQSKPKTTTAPANKPTQAAKPQPAKPKAEETPAPATEEAPPAGEPSTGGDPELDNLLKEIETSD